LPACLILCFGDWLGSLAVVGDSVVAVDVGPGGGASLSVLVETAGAASGASGSGEPSGSTIARATTATIPPTTSQVQRM
jgi:hypothetical protein